MLQLPRTSILLVLSASCFLTNAYAGAINAIDAFGDSLSDVGNIFTLTGGVEPAAPYVNGQFSNGNVAVQDLALDLGLARLTPIFRAEPIMPLRRGNFATSIATTNMFPAATAACAL